MPSVFPCCPENILGSKLNTVILVNTPPSGCESLETNFAIENNGAGEWGGTISDENGQPGISVELKCINGEAVIGWHIHGCDSSGEDGAALACGDDEDFLASAIVSAKRECCGDTPEAVDIQIDVFGGPIRPAGKPPKVPPPCSNARPEDCCEPPGEVDRGSPSTGDGGLCQGGFCGGGVGGGLPNAVSIGGGGGAPNQVSIGGGGRPNESSIGGEECCECSCVGSHPGLPGRGGILGGGGGGGLPWFSQAPVCYGTGELSIIATDIESVGFGVPWGHKRSFANRLSVSETLGQGFNWRVEQWPFLIVNFDGSVVVQGKPHETLWFGKENGSYVSRFNVKQTLQLDEANEVYKLFDLDGTVTEFDSATGAFQKRTDPGGNTIEVKAMSPNSFNFTQVERTFASGGSTTVEQYFYEYDNSTVDQLLERVTLRRKVDAGAWTNVSRANYTYYGENEAHGTERDLKTAQTQIWDGSQWSATGTTMYRYYKSLGSSSSSSSSGSPEPPAHLLKYVVNPQAYARLAADPAVSDPLTASNFKVSLYADYYFEYDVDRRVTKEVIQGGSRTYTFSYAESAFADDYNAWKTRATETLPGGGKVVMYNNFAGQPILKVFNSNDENDQNWIEFFKYNDNAQLVLHANPSAVSGYDESKADLLNEVNGNYQYLKDNDGLLHIYEYDADSGYLTAEKIQNGELGTPIKLREYEYVSCPIPGTASSSSSSSSSSSGTPIEPAAYFTSKEIVYPDDVDQDKKIVTTYSYTLHPGTCQVKEKTTTLPIVSTEQNGSGVADTRKEYFDVYGNRTWLMDECGFLTRFTYDTATGALTQMIRDVDTAQVTDEPEGWETPTGGGVHVVTDYEHDDLGRITQELGPAHTIDIDGVATSIRRARWNVYNDEDFEFRTAQGYATGEEWDTFTLVNPVSITKRDEAGNVLEQIQAARPSTSGKLTASDTFAQSTYVRWTTHQYTDCCILASTRVYHTIPGSGEGESGTNYDQTDFGYNSGKRQNRHVTPGGTITRTVLDVRGLPTAVYVGTDDTGATASDPTGGGAQGNNMVVVTEHAYDGAADGGDGNLTKQTQHVDSSTTRVTSFVFDWRNRQMDADGEIDFYERRFYDNLDRVTRVDRYDTAPPTSSSSSSSSGLTTVGNLILRNDSRFDDHGRVYQSIRYGVNPATGAVGNSLTDNTWFDPSGRVIKRLPAGAKLFSKSVYDGLGRLTKQYHGFDVDEENYAEAINVTGDTILEQSEHSFDAASNIVETAIRQRYHNATGTGELGTPSSVQPKARVSYTATWHDPVGRIIATVHYGTNSGSSLSRPSTIPARSDTVLVTNMTHNSAGKVASMTNPGGSKTCLEYDAAGRQVKQILNCTGSSSSSSSSSSGLNSDDVNVTVLTAYNADSNVNRITAVNAFTGDQTTRYVYGTTLADSDIASSLLKRAEIYPDSDDTADPRGDGADETYDRIEFKYNRQAQVTQIKDQNETIHTYDYDDLGRHTQDRVTALGGGVDGAVRRIASKFEVRGMREKITSYDNASVGSGNVVNEVQFAYNDFGQLVSDYQAHGGAVNTATTPNVRYGYSDGSADTIRPTALTYPDGRVLTYNYGSSGSIPDAASRIAALVDDDAGSTHLADYSHLGLGTFIEVDYTEPDIEYTLVGTAGGNDPDTGDIYRGFDRFGRVKDSYWYHYGSSTDVDRIKYDYDRNGSPLYRQNMVATANNTNFDEKYLYDLIDRLKQMDRGQLTAQKDSVTDTTFAQCWTLDATGNWRKFLEDSDGDGTWSLHQTRIANKANEITDFTESTGPLWVTPVYSRAGNMTTIPKPADPVSAYTATYDGWNRLLKIKEGANTVVKYEYDGANRRTVKESYSGGIVEQTRHFYYTDPRTWQVIEERVNGSSDAERQFVWGLRYFDDIVERDRDTAGDGTLDERLYALQDSNTNVTAIIDDSGSTKERFGYGSYGSASVFDPVFNQRTSSLYDWETTFAGYQFERLTGMYCVRQRVYVPKIGWIQRGTSPEDGMNLYAYVSGRPTILKDPYGKEGIPGPIPLPLPPIIPIIQNLPTICPIVQSDVTTCVCCLIQLADISTAAFAAAVGVEIPIADEIINGFDCLCDFLDMLNALCVLAAGGPIWPALGIDVTAIASCIVNVVDIFAPPGADKPILLADVVLAILEQVFTHNAGCNWCFPACKNALPGMAKGVLRGVGVPIF